MSKNWIQTHPTCRKFFVLRPRAADIDIRDIARALSMQCRFVGHVSRFYSVAEHCVRACWLVQDWGGTKRDQLWALLHDASEAYLGDVSRPLKHTPDLAAYRRLEARTMRAICRRFGLPPKEPELVTKADVRMLGPEALQLKAPVHPHWHRDAPGGKRLEDMPGCVLGWMPDDAEQMFLREFNRLRRRRRLDE